MDRGRGGRNDTPDTGEKRDSGKGRGGGSSPPTELQQVKQIFAEIDALWPETKGRGGPETLPPELDSHEIWGNADVRAALGLPADERRPRDAREGATHYDLDRPLPDGVTGREHLERFDPRRARLPDVSAEEAERYILGHHDRRPWLRLALDSPPEVTRVYAALDQSNCHALQRHEGFGDDEMQRRRVLFREDPAQLDQSKREVGLDGVNSGQIHYCGGLACRVHERDAFAVAVARALEHPDVRAVLDRTYQKGARVSAVAVPIADLLGPEGHRSCSGYFLLGNSPREAAQERDAWQASRAKGVAPAGIAPPRAVEIGDFEGGFVEVRFKRNQTKTGYELSTIFPVPRQYFGGHEVNAQ